MAARVRRSGAVAAALAIALAPVATRAQVPPPAPEPAPPIAPAAPVAPIAPAAPVAPPAPPTPAPPPPTDAPAALQRARAAYEYGDLEAVVDSARLVAEGRLHPTPAQRAQALRYLGIGLYLTARPEGAETAFFDLLRLRPETRLDSTTTRPDCVSFFEDVRRRHADEIRQATRSRTGMSYVLTFLPPLGQFQEGHTGRGIAVGALEALSLGTAIATKVQLSAWRQPGDIYGSHTNTARTLQALNYVSVIVLVATVAAGIIDGVASYGAERDDTQTARLDGWGLRF
jgi:hypothetical protein